MNRVQIFLFQVSDWAAYLWRSLNRWLRKKRRRLYFVRNHSSLWGWVLSWNLLSIVIFSYKLVFSFDVWIWTILKMRFNYLLLDDILLIQVMHHQGLRWWLHRLLVTLMRGHDLIDISHSNYWNRNWLYYCLLVILLQ